MAEPPDDDVGYRRPPKSKRWKGGQSGNPRNRTKPKPVETPLTVVERLLLSPVDTKKDGHPTKMPMLEAIIYQLLKKSLNGDKKADRTLQKFKEFAERNSVAKFEIVFVDNEYTQAFAASQEDSDD
ncbi:DUF5681 domain-containing protein [Bradyrhizobium sp. 6(2017)]|uniref:DUF5681 domain-containing protein n=1 Tax=Bradyrhizobium sp. 6(2017) TaxID=1197460 RepID=UPI0013E10F7D|nr:DUF5681 domain-containing protein [Bradyrhizobium sp. 6(2017)]QIG98090.1 hypothetical protein G6P99_41725 [Bradyrhizobium sp. 6(2017)]